MDAKNNSGSVCTSPDGEVLPNRDVCSYSVSESSEMDEETWAEIRKALNEIVERESQ
jgi:hypothetical protein